MSKEKARAAWVFDTVLLLLILLAGIAAAYLKP
jgi:hypothetical protein